VPWIPASPPALVQPAPAAACKARNLRVSRAPIFKGGLTGGGYTGSVIVRNAGPPCSLLAAPKLGFAGAASASVHVRQEALTKDIAPAVDPLPPTFSMRAVPTGGTVWLAVAWRSWCASAPPTTFEVILPSDGGTLRFFPGGTPACHGAKATSIVQTDSFRPYVRPPAKSTTIPLSAKLEQSQYRVARGSTLHYAVMLENQTGFPYRFKRCPVYVEQLGTPENILKGRGIAKEVHYLNCRGVVVKAYSSVTFAMQLHVPETLAKGFLLEWQLDPHSYSAPFAPAGVTLTR
jgi:hypothetical protein